jgi:Transposase domain (DUF772)
MKSVEHRLLVRVDRVLDLSWLRNEVADLYCPDDGRPGTDPKVAVRLMLADPLTGIVHDRKLMREAHVTIAIRWRLWHSREAARSFEPDTDSPAAGGKSVCKIFKGTVEACL